MRLEGNETDMASALLLAGKDWREKRSAVLISYMGMCRPKGYGSGAVLV